MLKEAKEGFFGVFWLILFVGVPLTISLVSNYRQRSRWDKGDPIVVSVEKPLLGVAHSNSRCKKIRHIQSIYIPNEDIDLSYTKFICSECFSNNDAEQLRQLSRHRSDIKESKEGLVREIRKIHPNYSIDDLNRDLKSKSGQDFIAISADDYINKKRMITLRELYDEIYAFAYGFYYDSDINQAIRWCYYKYKETTGSEPSLNSFADRIVKDIQFARSVYDRLKLHGYNVGEYDEYISAININYEDHEDYIDED